MKSITNNLLTAFIFITLLALAGLVSAQEDSTSVSIESETSTETSGESTEIESTTAVTADTNDDLLPAGRPANSARQEEMEARRVEAEANQAERQDRVEERKVEIQANIAERKAALEVRAQERITNLAANMSNRMDAVIARIQNIIDRLETRIAKLKETGLDTAAAESSLASAQVSINAAASAIGNIDAEVAAAVGSEDARAGWVSVKESYSSIRNHIKQAHTELRATVAALKAAAAEMSDGRGVSDAVRVNSETEVETTAN